MEETKMTMSLNHFFLATIVSKDGGFGAFILIGSILFAAYYYYLMKKARNPTQRAMARKALTKVIWTLVLFYVLALLFLLAPILKSIEHH